MSHKLFIIGNGFDIAHGLPTRFDPDFKRLTRRYEQDNFWDIYQSCENDIWSDFENLLAHPDFNCLEEIFESYAPDYWSDRESDRDAIITQVELNGNLEPALYEFANNADEALQYIVASDFMKRILDPEGYYLTFNYTHTLEWIYGIPAERILHIHGEVGEQNLELGYPEGNFAPEKYSYDVRGKGRGPYATYEIEDYIDVIEDYYVRTAYIALIEKCKSFDKTIRIDALEDFLNRNSRRIDQIIVYGHSCAIDFEYFNYLCRRYPVACWKFYVKGMEQEENVEFLIQESNLYNAEIVLL